jgi:transposase
MKLYGGIDVHSTNSLVALLDAHDHIVDEKRLSNALNVVLAYLAPHQANLTGLVVESTYNWYWLVDGFLDAGYRVHLANTAAIKQYEGLQFSNDHVDARCLAQLLRWGIFPAGYIYPKEERAVRDLLRKRAQLVRQKVDQMLSLGSQFARHTGRSLGAKGLRNLCEAAIESRFTDANVALALTSNLRILRCLAAQIQCVEREVLGQMKTKPEMTWLQTVPGIGNILARTIVLETGTMARFAHVGDFASYCRCVKSQRLSNGKVKGRGNAKNGKPSLGWACVEAANFAIRFDAEIKRFSQRRQSKRHRMVALKTVANKLARACYDIMRDHVPFERSKAFGV